MPRISKSDHPAILRMVDQEHRKVAEVAAQFGCTAANIYALLAKLRRDTASPPAAPEPMTPASAGAPAAVDLFATPTPPLRPAPALADMAPSEAVSAPPRQATREPTSVMPLARPASARRLGGVGAAQAKPGVGLMMRTADGEENLTPFRSLDDLLSAVKPILRAAARSPDAVWFCIQPIDLASLDSDAA